MIANDARIGGSEDSWGASPSGGIHILLQLTSGNDQARISLDAESAERMAAVLWDLAAKARTQEARMADLRSKGVLDPDEQAELVVLALDAADGRVEALAGLAPLLTDPALLGILSGINRP